MNNIKALKREPARFYYPGGWFYYFEKEPGMLELEDNEIGDTRYCIGGYERNQEKQLRRVEITLP